MIGRIISHYRILERLGSGGMGTVFLAEDTRLHRKVALKFLNDPDAGDAQSRARLQREAEAASALDHPHVATIYEVAEAEGQLFIAMAYYAGETLRDRLARGRLSIENAASIAEQVAEGLAAAHSVGVVHRDLKPANIVLTSTEQVKILDFGLAKQVAPEAETRSALTGQGTTLGTIGYMSPEQARAELVGPESDIWSLGVVLFEMITGRPPFTGASAAAVLAALLTEPVPSIKSLRPEVPSSLARVAERALEKDPQRRTITAAEIAQTLREFRAGSAAAARAGRAWYRNPKIAIPVTAVLIVALVAAGAWARNAKHRHWVRSRALPEIEELSRAQRFAAAFELARKAEAFVPDDAALAAAWKSIARPFSITTEPAGASVSIADYGDTPVWTSWAASPTHNARFPRGPVRVHIEKNGFEPVDDVVGTAPWMTTAAYTLVPAGGAPAGMVRASATEKPISTFVFGLELSTMRLNAFWIDRNEVRNKDFKAFVDAGGYRQKELWRDPFVRDGRALSWEDAMRSFVDATGRPGPAVWELGSYPNGEDDLPVRGVSWFEARAYAAWAGKSLPTIYHWSWVASLPLTGFVIPLANLHATGPLPVTTGRAIHRFGALDLAGNVKEWVANDTGSGMRYILGGGWDEPAYMFADADARSPFDRAPNFGFRCVRYDVGDASIAAASAPARPPSRDYAREKPVGDAVFEAYKRLFSYDKTDLAASIDAVDDSDPGWRRERVSFAAAYGGERVIAYVYLPRGGKPPYQTVFIMPGAGAWDERSSEAVASGPFFAYLVKSGRAVVFPLYKGTFERGSDAFKQDVSKASSLWRDYTIAFSKDLSRAIDYAETRPELDKDRFAFFGTSRGGALAPVVLANESRIKTAVLWIPGLYSEPVLPEVDVVNFLPRMTIPTLVVSGKYDYNFPDKTSSRPFFELMGTSPDRKRRVVFDTGHNLPQNEAVKETLDWLDRELGGS
jgi:formylglycine-generating enzyme required for sulfatase activity/dienelactone hydrolase